MAQDGHIANTAFKDHRDVRVGSGPTIYGERPRHSWHRSA
jgi:hypothetical protein